MFKRGWIVCLLIVLSPTAFAVGQELRQVKMGYPSLGFRQGHIWVAKDEGLFANTLDVEPVFLRGGQLAIQALAAAIRAHEYRSGRAGQPSGFDLVLIAGVESFMTHNPPGRYDPA
jgi:hypothetical protein